MKKRIGNIVRWLVTIGIFYYLFKYKVDASDIWQKVRNANWIWLCGAVALFGTTFCMGVYRWYLLLQSQDIHVPLRRVTAICFVGQFFNAFLLGATGGDVIKSYYAAKQTQTHKAEAVMSVFVDRIIGLVGLFIIAIVMMAWQWRWLYDHPNLRVPSLVVLGLIVAVCAAIPLSFWRGLPNKFGWLNRLKSKIRFRDHISRALDSYQGYLARGPLLAKTVLLSMGVHTTIFIGVIFLGRGLNVEGIGWDKYFLILPMINTIASMPISISGFGLREGMYTLMFGDLGVAANVAVALGLLSYAAQFFWSLVGGLVYMFWKHEPHMLQHAKEDLEKETGSQ